MKRFTRWLAAQWHGLGHYPPADADGIPIHTPGIRGWDWPETTHPSPKGRL
jgi:hypothetical protein